MTLLPVILPGGGTETGPPPPPPPPPFVPPSPSSVLTVSATPVNTAAAGAVSVVVGGPPLVSDAMMTTEYAGAMDPLSGPSTTVTDYPSAVNCDDRLPGQVPGILIDITSALLANIVGITDASFEDGTTGSAVPTGCTISNSTTQALDGTHSLELVCTTAGATAGAMSVMLGPYPVFSERPYTITANIRGGASRSVTLTGYYYAGDTEIGSAGTTTVTDSATSWLAAPFLVLSDPTPAATSLFINVSVAAPAGPISAPIGLTATATGTTGSQLYGYLVTSVNAYGESLPGARQQVSNGNAVLVPSTIYNALAWTAVSGATEYNIYRGSPVDCGGLPSEFATCADIWTALPTCAALLTYIGIFGFVAQVSGTSYHDSTNGPLGPPGPPTTNTTGEPAYIDEVGGFSSGTVTQWSLAPEGTVMVIRSDGQYVQGASPLSPLQLDDTGHGSVTDLTAPYGLPVSYVATLFQLDVAEAPSLASVPVVMGQAPDTCELYERLGWAKDEDSTGLLEQWLSGIGQMLGRVDSISSDFYDAHGNVAPSWSTVLDVDRCPTYALPWLGQFVGVRFPPTLRDDLQRYIIKNCHQGWNRGTPASIIAAANQYLLPGYSATLAERYPDPYSLGVTVPRAGIVGTATCLAVMLAYATCSALISAFATCADLWTGVNEVETAVNAAIPAGIVTTITLV